jgi:hypothetical protein
MRIPLSALLFLPFAVQSATTAPQSAYPQKFVTFYALDDLRVPIQLKQQQTSAVATDGATWQAVKQGLVRHDPKAAPRDRDQYFAGRRYLPDDEVQSIVVDSSAGIWVQTMSGIAHIELRPMTLEAKADLFEQRIRMRHNRHGLVSPSNLTRAGDLSSNQMRDDDNDGLWTSIYAAAECFRYAVTHSPDALTNARKSTEAVLFLEEVAGKRGFPARSYIRKGEPMPKDGQWHWTKDGQYYWKGDTSSDEIVGHMFLYSVATDLLPVADLKKRIAATTTRIMDHILDHGYYLIDVTGEPTTWGRWSPEYFKQAVGDSTLNSLELLSFLKSASHITGKPRYEAEYRKVALDMGYAQLTTRYKELREEINYSDEELAMLPLYCLFRYETDVTMQSRYYRPALEAWWDNEKREENPLWTFIYALRQPEQHVDLTSAIRTLNRMPIDTIDWTVKNSQRDDIVMDTSRDRFGKPQSKTLLPPDERPVMKWNANPFEVDGGSGGLSEDDGAAFLLPYWLGRFHRLI